MHLKAITIKGFKSFPDRTHLRFEEGVSVIVGPNGSGKSNITDAVLWALGEQSPLAVRGQSMQDVIFAGGRGVQARSEAEVELVLDNSDGSIDLPVAEISIARRLSRAGEGEYRLNGARCRLLDILEALSDSGLGKEAHSVISQGRVEAIVTSRPRDRRLLIEEAAGLGKHRKRRRRAQLKLERTEVNLGHALDVEREARARLRPLKRQAEAAERHESLERQWLEAQWAILRETLRARLVETAAAQAAALEARAAREAIQAQLGEVSARRDLAEQALAQRSARHEHSSQQLLSARSARERLALRLEQARGLLSPLEHRTEHWASERAALEQSAASGSPAGASRVHELEAALVALDGEREAALALEVAALEGQRDVAADVLASREAEHAAAVAATAGLDERTVQAREALRAVEVEAERARRDCAAIGADLAAANQFLRSHSAAPFSGELLDGAISVEPGYELAVAAVLGGRLRAALADDGEHALRLLGAAGEEGGRVLVADLPAGARRDTGHAAPALSGAQRLSDLVTARGGAAAVLERLFVDTWVVDDLEQLPGGFSGTLVTRGGRLWRASSGELRQVAGGGGERVLETRNHRDSLVARSAAAAGVEEQARRAVEIAEAALAGAIAERERAAEQLRGADRAHAEAAEVHRRAGWMIEQRRAAPDQGAIAVRRAQIEGELAAERRAVERVAREAAARAARLETLTRAIARDRLLVPQIDAFIRALEGLGDATAARLDELEASAQAERAAGEELAGALRACAGDEVGLRGRLAACSDALTTAEVSAQRARDQTGDAEAQLSEVAARLSRDSGPGPEPLEPDELAALRERSARVAARREQLGPVNPLAGQEYQEALARLEEFEAQRGDLEVALRELRTVIRDTDRQISTSFNDTFEAAASNFKSLVEDVFPGGQGRLRMVRDDTGPRPVLGGQAVDDERSAEIEGDLDEARAEGLDPDALLGVEIEITPAGKSMKSLSLLSGGEKSMTAIAFLFAVFLARPCPFYILDEVEAALDDPNIDRFLALLRRHSQDAQFIVVTHQKRTMEAADCLYGVSMGADGTSRVISRRLGEGGLAAASGDQRSVERGVASLPQLAAADAA